MPARIRRDEPSQGRCKNRRDERRPCERRDGTHQFRLGGGPQNRKATNRDHHGAARALQHPRRNEKPEAWAHGAQQRGERKNRYRAAEHEPRAEAICHPAAQRQQHSQSQKVRRHSDAEIGRAYTERDRHLGDRSGDHGSVEELHEEGPRYQKGEKARLVGEAHR